MLVKIPPPSERGPSAALFSDLLSRSPGNAVRVNLDFKFPSTLLIS